jgi:DNA-binding NtrC family response regulator
VPALRDRTEDIPLLVEHFISKICEEYSTPPKRISQEALDSLKKMRWSGNIRELRNAIERLIVLSGDEITAEDIKLYC